MTEKIRVACIGAGWATSNRHLPALRRDRRVRLVGIVDRHLERARAAAEKFDVPVAADSLAGAWTNEVDCVTIGTPPSEHAACVEAALERGWHCLCEKPFVLPSRRGAELTEIARKDDLVLAAVHNFQFARAGQRLFELIDSEALGVLHALYAFQLSNPRRGLLPTWYRSLNGGLFLDEASHLLYLMRRVLGRLETRQVDGRVVGTEVRDINATFAHETIWATLAMSFDSSISEWTFTVIGSEATAVWDIFRDLVIVLPNDDRHRARDVLASSRRLLTSHAGGFVRSGFGLIRHRLSYGNDQVVRRFLDAVEGDRERLQGIDGRDGCEVVACIEDLLAPLGLQGESPARIG